MIRKVEADFEANGKAYTPGMIADKLKEFEADAKAEVAEEQIRRNAFFIFLSSCPEAAYRRTHALIRSLSPAFACNPPRNGPHLP